MASPCAANAATDWDAGALRGSREPQGESLLD